jgi:hypothetical protein
MIEINLKSSRKAVAFFHVDGSFSNFLGVLCALCGWVGKSGCPRRKDLKS